MTSQLIKYLHACLVLIVLGLMPDSSSAQQGAVKPYQGENAITAKLFNLDEPAVNFHFTAELPGGNFLIIECDHLSDWSDKADLQHIISVAKTYATLVQDSFKSATTAKRLDIHIPAENEPVTMMITEHNSMSNVLIVKGNVQAPLKMNMDTIRVLKTLSEKTIHHEHRLIQMQYTFLLKDMDQAKNLDADKSSIAGISDKFDNVVHKYRHRWNNQDKWTHNLTVSYFPSNDDPGEQISIKKVKLENEQGRYYRAFEADWSAGATIFRNNVCPITEVGLSYKWPARNSAYNFARISGSSFPNIIWNSPTTLDVYPVQFLNLEFGWIKSKQNMHIPLFQASAGIGYYQNFKDDPASTLKYHDPSLPDNMVRLFLSFKLSKIFTITLENYGKYNGITGMIRLY